METTLFLDMTEHYLLFKGKASRPPDVVDSELSSLMNARGSSYGFGSGKSPTVK
jgi:hypothetical protein